MSHKSICWTRDAEAVHQHPLTDIYVQRVPWCQDGHSQAASHLAKMLEKRMSETKADESDGKVGIIGYEINFNRYFYTYEPPRPLDDIEADIKKIESEIMDMLREVAG